MASIKLVYGSTTETCWSDTGKITTPSLILNDNGTTRYTPLFSGNAGAQVVNGSYKYTLGHLIVGGNRVAIGRENNTYTNTIKVEFYTDTSTNWIGSNYAQDQTKYTKKFERNYYVRVLSSSVIQYGSVSTISINPGTAYVVYDQWFLLKTATNSYTLTGSAIRASTSSGMPADYAFKGTSYPDIENSYIKIRINGQDLSQTPNWSESVQQITFTQSGTYQ